MDNTYYLRTIQSWLKTTRAICQVRITGKTAIRTVMLLLIVIGPMIWMGGCNEDPRVCFEIDGADCPGAITGGAALSLTYRSYTTMYVGFYFAPGNPLHGMFYTSSAPFPGGSPIESLQTTSTEFGTAGGTVNEDFIEGYEINYGFWSADSYRRYSYRELFEWKYKRPWVPSDGTITDAQAREWFTERHRVKRTLPSESWDNPRDIRTFKAPLGSVCFTVTNGSGMFARHEFSGEIHFANGIRCRIEPNPTVFRESFGTDGSPHKKKLRIEKPCAGC